MNTQHPPSRAELAQRMGELNGALLTVAALRMLFTVRDRGDAERAAGALSLAHVDDAEQLRVAKALLAGELGVAVTPTLDPRVFKWTVVDKAKTFVLELGERNMP